MRNINKALLLAALGMTATAQAADQGTLGETSTGKSDVTLVKDNAVMITDVGDLDLGTLSSTSVALEDFDDVCVFNSTANYKLTATSLNTAFELKSGTNTIPYALSWTDDVLLPGSVVPYGTTVSGLVGDQTSANCGGGTNARFTVSVTAVDFNSAAPGTYTDTVTLLITPE